MVALLVLVYSLISLCIIYAVIAAAVRSTLEAPDTDGQTDPSVQ